MKEPDEKPRELAKAFLNSENQRLSSQTDPTWPDTREERLRKGYRPLEIRVLFVGESPPEDTFFYDTDSFPSRLHQHTREAFGRIYATGAGRGRAFLSFFKARGCYLDDLSWIRGIAKSPTRDSLRQRGVSPLANRMKEYSPKVVIVVMKGIIDYVSTVMIQADLGSVSCHVVPFPARSEENERRYVQELADIIRDLKKEGILLDP